MAPRKNRPVLYEVVRRASLRKGKGPLARTVPPPQQPSKSPVEPPERVVKRDERARPAAVPETAPAKPPVAAPSPTPVESVSKPPTPTESPSPRKTPAPASRPPSTDAMRPSFADGASAGPTTEAGFRFSALGSNAAIIGAAGILLVAIIVIANQWAPSSGSTPTTPSQPSSSDYVRTLEPGDTANNNADPAVADSAPTTASNPHDNATTPTESQSRKAEASTVELVRGKYYVVIQYFPRSKRDDATEAAKFLLSNGVPCALLEGSRDVRLVATEAFDIVQSDGKESRNERRRGDQLVRRIKELGKEYGPTGGYRFEGAELQRIN